MCETLRWSHLTRQHVLMRRPPKWSQSLVCPVSCSNQWHSNCSNPTNLWCPWCQVTIQLSLSHHASYYHCTGTEWSCKLQLCFLVFLYFQLFQLRIHGNYTIHMHIFLQLCTFFSKYAHFSMKKLCFLAHQFMGTMMNLFNMTINPSSILRYSASV